MINTHSLLAPSIEEAKQIFNKAGLRLLNRGFWCSLFDAPENGALYNKEGLEVDRLIKKNDFIRIGSKKLGIPDSPYDWLTIDKIESSTNHESGSAHFSIEVIPSAAPFGEASEEIPAAATVLSVTRESGKVTIGINKTEPPSTAPSRLGTTNHVQPRLAASHWEKIVQELTAG